MVGTGGVMVGTGGTGLSAGGSVLETGGRNGAGGADGGMGGAGDGGWESGSGGSMTGSGGAIPGSGGASSGGTSSGGASSGGASSGGTSGGGASSGGASSGGAGNQQNPELIDDFEDGDVDILEIGGRVGSWYTFNETEGAADSAPSARPLAPEPESSGDGFVMHASGVHINAGALDADAAYGGIGVDLNNENLDGYQSRSTSRMVYDAGGYDGIRFWVRSTGPDSSLRFEVVTEEIVDGPGGTCNVGPCWDAFGVSIPLTADWTEIEVPFSTLVQEGWGANAAFEPSHILGLSWNDKNTSDWDFWLDDVEFYVDDDPEDPPPGGCVNSWGEQGDGSVTWYTFDQGTPEDVNCSFGITIGSDGDGDLVNHVSTGAGTYFAAMNTADYDDAAVCGACVEVTRDGGPSVVVTVVDQCPIATNPKCVAGHIDLSKAAFLQLGTEEEGYLGARAGLGEITWRYVSCPTTGTAKFRLKEADNANWNQVIVENHPYPIESVQVRVDSAWVDAAREAYNYWSPPEGRFGSPPYDVLATDITGGTIQGTLILTGESQDTGTQFVCE